MSPPLASWAAPYVASRPLASHERQWHASRTIPALEQEIANIDVNVAFIHLGLASLKPFLAALLLPPVPCLILVLAGAATRQRLHRLGTSMVVAGCALVWASGCLGFAEILSKVLLAPPPALTAEDIRELRTHVSEPVAIVVLGGGVEQFAPEYGDASLHFRSLERLRYGIWLSREIGWPVAFSGGVGWGQQGGGTPKSTAEASVAQRIATREFGHPLHWVESASRDTRENAIDTAAMLAPLGIRRIVLVTHAWHMPRALGHFRKVAAGVNILGAPIGLAVDTVPVVLRWIPTGEGVVQTRLVLREWLGTVAGA